MDMALQCYMEAREYIDSFIDLSLSDIMFEDTNDVKEKEAHNEQAKSGALNSLKRMIDALVNMVKDIMIKITNFIKSGFLSKDERERYKEFKRMMRENPEMAKQTITIEDWRVYEKAYDEALKQLEAEANKPDPSLEVANKIVEALSKKIESYASEGTDIASRAALQTTLDAAIDIADKNVMCAKAINLALQTELVSLDKVREQLGEKEAAKFQKKIDRLSRAGAIHRLKVKIFNRKQNTLSAVLKKQFNRILSYTNIKDGKLEKGKLPVDQKSLIKGMGKNAKFTTKALGGVENATKTATDMAMDALNVNKAKRAAKKTVKKFKRDVNDLKEFMGVKKNK